MFLLLWEAKITMEIKIWLIEGIKNNKFTVRQVEQLTAYILKLISQLDTTKYKRNFFL